MNTPHTVSDDRLAQIMDGEVTAFQYEIPVIAAELLARRAADRQRESARYHGPDVPEAPNE